MTRRPPWALALVALLALAAACSSGDDATPAPTPAATAPTPSPTTTASPPDDPSPAPDASATPRPPPPSEVGVPRAVEFGPSDASWQRYEPPVDVTPDGSFLQLLYEVDSDELWTLAGPNAEPYFLVWSPHDDAAVAVRAQSRPGDPSETVLLDPASGDVRRLLPFGAGVVDWPEPDRVLVRVGIVVGGRDGPSGWTRGLYELDLAAETMTLLEEGDRFSEAVPVPDGSQLVPGRFERRIFPDDGWSALVYLTEDGDESFIRDRLAQIVWSPDRSRVALVGLDNELILFDTISGDQRPLAPPTAWWQIYWSPDGRYLAATFTSIRGQEVVIFDLAELPALHLDLPIPRVGPYESAIFADWGPGETTREALLLGDYCDPEGFLLDRLDLAGGELRRIPTESGGFWVYDWSPRGDLIAVSSWELDSPRTTGGFALIDPDTGATHPAPRLAAAVTTMQDVAWSPSGDWIAVQSIGGRDRCL